MNVNNITIDVVIPVYNGEKFILEAIESVANQTFQVSRIIVVDDGSTDSTAEIVKKYILEASENRIFYSYKDNGGLSSARNAGIKLSSSTHLAFLDSDDIWHFDKLKCQVDRLLELPNSMIGVVYCDYWLVDEFSNFIKQPKHSNIIKSVRGNVYRKLLRGNYIASSGSGILVDRSCFEKVGYFDEELSSYEDWDMWLRLSRYFNFEYVERKLVFIRRHNAGLQNNSDGMLLSYAIFLNKLFSRRELLKRHYFFLRLQIWYRSIGCEDFVRNINLEVKFKKILCGKCVAGALLFFLTLRNLKIYCSNLLPKFISKNENSLD